MRLALRKAAGYKLDKLVRWNGLQVAVENRAGTVRQGRDASGKPWRTKMLYDYGGIRGTSGFTTDSDLLDCFVGPHAESQQVYVIHQQDPRTGRFDEDKVMLGFLDWESARNAYLAHYDDQRFLPADPERVVTAMALEQFKGRIKDRAASTVRGRGMLKGVGLRKARAGLVARKVPVKQADGRVTYATRWVRPGEVEPAPAAQDTPAQGALRAKLKPGDPHPDGHVPSTPEQRQVIKDRGVDPVPPASWGLWVNPDPKGKIQATWYDARGRKQYRYHPRHGEEAHARKFESLREFMAGLPKLRRAVARDLRLEDADPDRVAAAVARLIDLTGIRVGSEEYAEREGDPTFGAATLRKEHVQVKGRKVILVFVGKHHKEHVREVSDAALVEVVAHLLSLPGERVFQARRRGDGLAPVTSGTVNAYLRAHGGRSAKVFRTYHATRLAAELLTKAGPPKDEREAKRAEAEVMERVAGFLGNTPAVARSSYVDPAILEAYRAGRLTEEVWR